MLSLPGSLSRKERCGDGLGSSQCRGIISDNGTNHPWSAGIPVALYFRQTAQRLDHRIIRALTGIRTAFSKSANRDINDVGPNGAHGVFAEADPLGCPRTKVVDQGV